MVLYFRSTPDNFPVYSQVHKPKGHSKSNGYLPNGDAQWSNGHRPNGAPQPPPPYDDSLYEDSLKRHNMNRNSGESLAFLCTRKV